MGDKTTTEQKTEFLVDIINKVASESFDVGCYSVIEELIEAIQKSYAPDTFLTIPEIVAYLQSCRVVIMRS